jgi:hypothetical protein
MKNIVVLMTVLILWGCGPSLVRMYSGPELPEDRIAKLEFYEPIRVYSLDGIQVSLNWGVIAMLPGSHTVSVGYFNAFSGLDPGMSDYKYSIGNISLSFDAKPGHTYGIRYSREGNSWRAWIEDSGE